MKRVQMEIEKRTAAALREYILNSGLAVVIGRQEEQAMTLDSTAEFMLLQREGRENICGLPIVRVDQDSYFAVEVPK